VGLVSRRLVRVVPHWDRRLGGAVHTVAPWRRVHEVSLHDEYVARARNGSCRAEHCRPAHPTHGSRYAFPDLSGLFELDRPDPWKVVRAR
jgi:hypothetical protein